MVDFIKQRAMVGQVERTVREKEGTNEREGESSQSSIGRMTTEVCWRRGIQSVTSSTKNDKNHPNIHVNRELVIVILICILFGAKNTHVHIRSHDTPMRTASRWHRIIRKIRKLWTDNRHKWLLFCNIRTNIPTYFPPLTTGVGSASASISPDIFSFTTTACYM